MAETLETPQRVLVVTPHPDDAEIGCGGTVAKWVKEGTEVFYLLCTNGDKGSDDPEMTSERLAATREREQQEAVTFLGVKELVMLHYPDGELEDTPQFRKEIVRAIRRFRPDIVLCTDPYRRSFHWHRDHRIAGQVTADAVFPYARDWLHFRDLWEEEELEPHKAGMALFWGAEAPDTYVDITDTIDTKIEALLCHQSQISINSGREPGQFLRENAQRAGEAAGVKCAEAFRALHFRR